MILMEPEPLYVEMMRLTSTTTEPNMGKFDEKTMHYPDKIQECMIGLYDDTHDVINIKEHNIGALMEKLAIHKALIIISHNGRVERSYLHLPLFTVVKKSV